jgi:DNA-binding NarL/FixJ family response regulator
MRILIADDDRAFAEYLGALVSACEHEVVATVTGGGLPVLQSYAEHRPDVVLLDVMMPKLNGFTICQQLVSRHPSARVILMSGLVASDYPSIKSCRASGFLPKPITFDSLRAALDNTILNGAVVDKAALYRAA